MKTGDQLKQEGLDLVIRNNAAFILEARNFAIQYVKRNGRVTIDQIRNYAYKTGIKPKSPNAWGAVFRGSQWHLVGYTKSKIPSNHSRIIGIWEVK